MQALQKLARFTVSLLLAVGPGLSALLLTPMAFAQTDGAIRQPWEVRADAMLFAGAVPFGPTAGALGGTGQYKLLERVAVEGSVGMGVGNRVIGGKDAAGWTFGGAVRTSPLMSQSRVHALSVAAGEASFFGGGYGDLHFAFAELGWEVRTTYGPSLLIALGPNLLLSRPTKTTCTDTSWLSLCQEFRQGELAPLGHLHVGLGWAF